MLWSLASWPRVSEARGSLFHLPPSPPPAPSYPTLRKLAERRPDIPIYVGNTERPVFWQLPQSGVQLTNINVVPFGTWQQVRHVSFSPCPARFPGCRSGELAAPGLKRQRPVLSVHSSVYIQSPLLEPPELESKMGLWAEPRHTGQ